MPSPIKLITSDHRPPLCFLWTDSSDTSGGEVRKKPQSGPCWTYVHVLAVSQRGRVRTVRAIRGETSPPSVAAAATDVTLLVAFAALSRDAAEFGVTLMCHLDLDARSLPAERPTRPPLCLFHRARARLASCEQKNVAPFSVIPQERASLEGTVQQKPGHCGC